MKKGNFFLLAGSLLFFPLVVFADISAPVTIALWYPEFFVSIVLIEFTVYFVGMWLFFTSLKKKISLFSAVLFANILTSVVGNVIVLFLELIPNYEGLRSRSRFFYPPRDPLRSNSLEEFFMGILILFLLTTAIEWFFYKHFCSKERGVFSEVSLRKLFFWVCFANMASYSFLVWMILHF